MSELPFFSADFGDSPEREPAPAGKYRMAIYGLPKMKVSQNGEPYLVWQLNHTGENQRFNAVFENTMCRGKGAFRLREILKSMGYRKVEDNGRSLVHFLTANGQDPNEDQGFMNLAKTEGAPAQVIVNGEPVKAGMEIEVRLRIREAEGNFPARSEVEAYLAA